MSQVVHGKNIRIYSGTSGTTPIVAMAKSCTVIEQSEAIEKASPTNAIYKEYIAGRREWEISLSHLISISAPVEGLLKVGTTYTLRLVIGTTTKQGTALCIESRITGTTNNLGTGSIRFKGSGPLS